MPAKMTSEMPLPMPRSVICSPSHMMNVVPAVRVIMVRMRNGQPAASTNAPSPIRSMPTDIQKDWNAAMNTVPYRVYSVIFFRPASPSLARAWRRGTTTVRSCRTMDAVMYGMIPRAKIVTLESAPPENMSKKPIRPPAA